MKTNWNKNYWLIAPSLLVVYFISPITAKIIGAVVLYVAFIKIAEETEKILSDYRNSIEAMNDDIYDIKKHLGLSAKVRSKKKQNLEVGLFVERQLKAGESLERAIEMVEARNNNPHKFDDNWGISDVGKIDVEDLKEHYRAMLNVGEFEKENSLPPTS